MQEPGVTYRALFLFPPAREMHQLVTGQPRTIAKPLEALGTLVHWPNVVTEAAVKLEASTVEKGELAFVHAAQVERNGFY